MTFAWRQRDPGSELVDVEIKVDVEINKPELGVFSNRIEYQVDIFKKTYRTFLTIFLREYKLPSTFNEATDCLRPRSAIVGSTMSSSHGTSRVQVSSS